MWQPSKNFESGCVLFRAFETTQPRPLLDLKWLRVWKERIQIEWWKVQSAPGTGLCAYGHGKTLANFRQTVARYCPKQESSVASGEVHCLASVMFMAMAGSSYEVEVLEEGAYSILGTTEAMNLRKMTR